MSIQKWGGVAAIIEAFTYIFGFILFFGVLGPNKPDIPEHYLEFLINNRDLYFVGYLVIGILFSFTLILLVQSIYHRFKFASPEIMKFTTTVGYLWVFMILSSSMIFLSSLGSLSKYHALDAEHALVIYQALSVVIDALGGGIEIVGAVWVIVISYVGLKNKIYNSLLHYWGFVVGISGFLTLFSGFSFLSTNPFFELTTAIFGLGQIIWFLVLGICMLRDSGLESNS